MVSIQEIEERQRELEVARQNALRVSAENIPERRFGSGVDKSVQQQYIQRKQQANQVLADIQRQKQQLEQAKAQLISQQAQENEITRKQSEYNIARKYASQGKFPGGESKTIQKLYYDIRQGYQAGEENLAQQKAFREQGLKPIYKGGKLVGFEDTEKGMSYEVGAVPQIATKEPEQQARYEKVGFEFTRVPTTQSVNSVLKGRFGSSQQIQEDKTIASQLKSNYNKFNDMLKTKITYPVSKELNKLGVTNEKFSTLSTATNPFLTLIGIGPFGVRIPYIDKWYKGFISDQITEIKEQPAKEVILAGLGFGSSFLLKGAGVGVKAIESAGVGKYFKLTEFTSDFLKIPGGALTGTYLFGTGKDYLKQTTPEGKGGVIGKSFLELTSMGIGSLGGLKAFSKSSDYVRTFGKIEVPMEEIVAPEFLKGQKYPKIKYGQTAGQLKAEFLNPISIIQEKGKAPRLFTASPETFSKSTTALEGSSELYGLYGAPKVSPTFLKVSGEKYNLFGTGNLLSTSRPTALRTTTTGIEYAPGVRASQRTLAPLTSGLKRFFYATAEKGKAYIPFIKTEKESIIPMGTDILIGKKDYFFKMGGRRIPIFEATTLGGKTTARNLPAGFEKTTLGEFYSSYGKGSSSSILNPFNIQLTSYPSSSKQKPSSSSYMLPSSSLSTLSSPSKLSYGSLSSYKPSSYPSYKTPGVFSSLSYGYKSKPSRSYPSTSSGLSFLSYTRKKSSKTPILSMGKKSLFGNDLSKAFRTFVVSKGKKKYVGGLAPRGKALRAGELFALKSLRATFGIEPTKFFIKGKDMGFNVRSDIFRNFRIKHGKMIPLKDTYIQKKGKRLFTGLEIGEIQLARKKKKLQ